MAQGTGKINFLYGTAKKMVAENPGAVNWLGKVTAAILIYHLTVEQSEKKRRIAEKERDITRDQTLESLEANNRQLQEKLIKLSQENELLIKAIEKKSEQEVQLAKTLTLARTKEEIARSDLNNSWCMYRVHTPTSNEILDFERT